MAELSVTLKDCVVEKRVRFKNLSFCLHSGEVFALVGRNGCGKSTLSMILCSLIAVPGAEVSIFSEGQSYPPKPGVDIYYIFQNPENQIVGTVVLDDVAFSLENRGYLREEILEKSKNALLKTGLDGCLEMNPVMLSGGQKQRLAVAGALASGVQFLIMDEPTVMLDPKGREDVRNLIQDLKRDGMGILWITHDPEEILFCDRVLILESGILLESSDDFFHKGYYKKCGCELNYQIFCDQIRNFSPC